jgi:hypothetical protein
LTQATAGPAAPTDAIRPTLAILIDAENVGAGCWPAALAIAGRFGFPTILRAYVCHAPSPGWLAAEGVEIIDGRPADGPNAADFLMAMDAAVLAAEGRVDGFVLLTGDDGFAAVAQGLRQRGATVYALIPYNGNAVPRRLALTADLAVLVPLAPAPPAPPRPGVVREPVQGQDWMNKFRNVLASCPADDAGWVDLSEFGTVLKKSGVRIPKGKLSVLATQVEGVQCRGAFAHVELRLMSHSLRQHLPQDAEENPPPPTEEHPMSGLDDAEVNDLQCELDFARLGEEDEEIPF